MTDQLSFLQQLTDWSEEYVSAYARRLGYHVIHLANVGPGAAMASGPHGRLILPDLQILDLAGKLIVFAVRVA